MYRITAKSHKLTFLLTSVIQESTRERHGCFHQLSSGRVWTRLYVVQKKNRLPCLAGFRSPSITGLGSGLGLEW